MGHHLQAFLGADAALYPMKASRAFPHLARLPFGLALLPIDLAFIHEEDERQPPAYDFKLPAFDSGSLEAQWMEDCMARLGLAFARQHPLLYAFTDWFGGAGGSDAWLFAPAGKERQGTIERVGSVNEGLRRLGVKRSATLDEWDAVGLGAYRTSEWSSWDRWLKQGRAIHSRDRLG